MFNFNVLKLNFMKKSLLTITLLLAGIVSYAQVIFNVQSPASISGNYDLTYADPAGGWGSPDLTVAANSVTADLMFVEDGSAGLNAQGNPVSREGCNPLINDLTGKIAVIYRNTCEFGTKAFNAQTAGAIAAVIINREDLLVPMGPGADGANVTIPVAFISSVSGQSITDALNAGQTVTAFLGSKVGLFVNDLGMEKDKLLIPNVNTKPGELTQAPGENIQKFAAKIFNYGSGDQSNVMLKGEVTFGGNVVYSETVSVATTLISGDSVLVSLPDYQVATNNVGKYNLTYTVLSDSVDQYSSDDTFSVDFFISNGIFAYGQLDANDSIIANQGYRSSAATTTFQSCIHFQDPNASRKSFKGVYFAASVNDSSTLSAQEFTIHVNEWTDVFTDINDPAFTGLANYNLVEIATQTYTFAAETENKSVYVPLSTELTLTDNMRYLVCVETFDANTFIGYTDLDYGFNFDTLNQPISPVITDAGISIFGFSGSPAASIGMKFGEFSSTSINEAAISNVVVYPNPATDELVVKTDDFSSFSSVVLQDQLGRNVGSWNITSKITKLDVAGLSSGNYFLVLSGANSNTVQKVMIK